VNWPVLFDSFLHQAEERQKSHQEIDLPEHCEKALNDFIVIDVETTGFSPSTATIIQLCAVHYREHTEIDSFATYINPLCPIPPRITALTGIDDVIIADAPTFDEVKDSFIKVIDQSPLLTGYNFSFDLRFLSVAAGFQIAEKYRCFDTLALARRFIPCIGYKLCQVSAVVGYQTQFHNALHDCRACGEILNYISRNIDPEWIQLHYCIPSVCCHDSEVQQARHYYQERQKNLDCPISPERILQNGQLQGKTIVFTGLLSFGRTVAEEMARQAGALVRGSVSKKTNYLVVGEQDCSLVGSDGLSSKEEKAYQLNDECGARIKIISEVEYLMLLTQEGGLALHG